MLSDTSRGALKNLTPFAMLGYGLLTTVLLTTDRSVMIPFHFPYLQASRSQIVLETVHNSFSN